MDNLRGTRGLPGGPVVKALPSHFRGSNPWLGNCILCGMHPPKKKMQKDKTKKKIRRGTIEGAQGTALHCKQSDELMYRGGSKRGADRSGAMRQR